MLATPWNRQSGGTVHLGQASRLTLQPSCKRSNTIHSSRAHCFMPALLSPQLKHKASVISLFRVRLIPMFLIYQMVEYIVSFHDSFIFTDIPINEAVDIIQGRLEKDT